MVLSRETGIKGEVNKGYKREEKFYILLREKPIFVELKCAVHKGFLIPTIVDVSKTGEMNMSEKKTQEVFKMNCSRVMCGLRGRHDEKRENWR